VTDHDWPPAGPAGPTANHPASNIPASDDPTVAGTTIPMAAHGGYVEFGPDPRTQGQARRRGRRRAVVLSASTAALLLIGVGAYAGVRAWTGSGTAEPESAMPSSVGAFVRVDLDPGFDQKIAVNNLARKFPAAGNSTNDLITRLESETATRAGLTFDTDVKPWFGGRIGAGVWADAKGQPVTLIAIASKDDAKAKSTLSALRARKGTDSFGFAMEKGYALIAGADGDMQADAAAAAAAAHASSLADESTFTSTVSSVGRGNLLVGYANLNRLAPLLSRATGSALDALGHDGTAGTSPFGALGSLGSLATLKGRIAVGARATGDGIELRVHTAGMSSPSSGTKVMSTLASMPAATIVGASTSGLDPSSDTAKKLTQSLGSLAGIGGLGSDPSLGGTSGHGEALQGLIDNLVIPAVTAKQLTIEFTGLGTGNTPDVAITADERDAATATKLAGTVKQLVDSGSPIPLTVSQNGTSVDVTVGSPVTGGALGSSALFRTTMAGMSGATSAAYVDVQKVAALGDGASSPSHRSQLAPVKAIGVGSSTTSSGSDLLLRVVIK
jgi:Protein of unknown function (DUF3352)